MESEKIIWITTAEAAEILDCTPKTIRDWILAGKFRLVHRPGRNIKLSYAEVCNHFGTWTPPPIKGKKNYKKRVRIDDAENKETLILLGRHHGVGPYAELWEKSQRKEKSK